MIGCPLPASFAICARRTNTHAQTNSPPKNPVPYDAKCAHKSAKKALCFSTGTSDASHPKSLTPPLATKYPMIPAINETEAMSTIKPQMGRTN
jgi:hypothetical protein